MDQGYIKVYRKTFDHWLWEDEPKSKLEAWLWLIKSANYETKKIVLGNELIEVEPGDVITSEVKLSKEFKWSRTKLRKFLELLEQDTMIERKKDSKKTYLKICNYEKYNQSPNEKKQQKNSEETAEEQQENSEETAKKHNEELKSLQALQALQASEESLGENPKPKTKRFVKPSVEEIKAYCIERVNTVDPENFFDHYEGNGWMRGKNKIKDWKACVRTWERNQKPAPQKQFFKKGEPDLLDMEFNQIREDINNGR